MATVTPDTQAILEALIAFRTELSVGLLGLGVVLSLAGIYIGWCLLQVQKAIEKGKAK